ncbi:MAG: Hpt domain-containing protein [Archangium sp.]|nr:Hpt domain-containing protein [Archangium sp.]
MKVRISLRTKLMAMLVAACAMVLGIACAAFVVYDRSSSLQTKERTMSVLTDATGGSLAGAVAFGDPQAARYVLEKLAAEETAVAAAVYGHDGARLSSWERTQNDQLASTLGTSGPTGLVGNMLVLERPITSDGASVGTIRFAVSTRDLDERTRRFLFIAVIIFAACTLLAGLASLRLHRVITGPVSELAATATKVQATKDYSLRATSTSTDEIGVLTHSFNDMLASIAGRDAELEDHRKNLSKLVDERTAELRQRTAEMRLVFDTVDQGFVTIDRDGRMAKERSARFDEWFGAPAPGETFQQHVGRSNPDFPTRFEMGWSQVLDGFMPLEVTLGQLPSRLVVGSRMLQLSFTPMLDGEAVNGALVGVTDITRVVEAEARQTAEREVVAAVTRIIADRPSFTDFLEETNRLVEELSTPSLVTLQRGLHTIKGTAALFGVETVAAVCHQLEDELEAGERPDDLQARVRAAWKAFLDRVKPFLGDDSGRVTVSRHELQTLAQRLEQGGSAARVADDLRRWLLEPVGPRLELLAQRGQVLAERIGRGHVRFEVDGGDVRIEPGSASRLWPVLVHLVRNALDHGIEPFEEREQRQKPGHARLTFSARETNGQLVLEFKDDGRGIDWHRVAAKANLIDPRRDQLIEALFSDGFSTKDAATETSGRGVGLSAVVETVRTLGGDVDLESEPGRGTTFRLRIPLGASATLSQAA